jgi:hypothetical protein
MRRKRSAQEAPVANRPTIRELNDARNAKLREEMEVAIADGRLTVRRMTPRERERADLDRARGAPGRALRAAKNSARRAADAPRNLRF